MSTSLKREAEKMLKAEVQEEDEGHAREEALAMQELESRANIAQTEVFAKVKQVAERIMAEYSRTLDGAEDLREVMRAQGGKIGLRRLISEFENTLRTTP